MERISKKILGIVSVILLAIIMLTGKSKAALQANINTHDVKSDSISNWFTHIRDMEKSGEAMGLNEILNEDLTPSSESNNIDVHMTRSTEYGAVAILSVSGYGNPQKLQESKIKTTTGNNTGVYMTNTGEWVAAGSTFEVNPRYYDSYTGNMESARVGDALGNTTTPNLGCAGWHNSSAQWGPPLYFCRGAGYTIFSYGNGCGFSVNTGWGGPGSFRSRGVAVCGNGF